MPCGCKAKKYVQYIEPITRNRKITAIRQAGSTSSHNEESIKQDTYLAIKNSLDISSTTAPDQFCLNCVRKHLGLAYLLSQNTAPFNLFVAAGQVMCAYIHLKDTFYNYSMQLKDIALQLIRYPKVQPFRVSLLSTIRALSTDITADSSKYISLEPLEDQKQILNLALVYSLLFVQITYEEINKTWAAAYLNLFCYDNLNIQNTVQKTQLYRPLWKLIQSMKPMDSNYIAARQYIQSLVTKLYINQYRKTLLLDQKNQLFLQQYMDRSRKLKADKSLPQPS